MADRHHLFTGPHPAVIAAVAVAVIPRLLRWVHPQVWFEDSSHLYRAFTLLNGQRPFVDAIFGHPPTLEGFLSLLYALCGVSYRVAEAASALVMTAAALLVYDLSRRLTDRWTALAALAAFSLSPLFFRYHVYEREVFTTALTVFGFWMVTAQPDRSRTDLMAGAMVGLAVTIKVSALFPLAALAGFTALQKNSRSAVRCLAGGFVVSAAVWLLFLTVYGKAAFLQLIVLHFVKGGTPSVWANLRTVFIPGLNYLLVCGSGGLLLGAFVHRQPLMVAAFGLAAALTVFFAVFSGTLWPHNLIDLVFPLSLGTAFALGVVRSLLRRPERRYVQALVLMVPAVGFILAGALQVRYLKMGWGYVVRDEVAAAAAFLRRNSATEAPISAPHYLAAEARRFKIIDHRELTGPYLWMLQVLETEGIGGLKMHREFGHWNNMVRQTVPLWRARVDAAVRSRRLGAVVWDRIFPEWSFNQRIDETMEREYGLFSASGYRIRYQSGPYLIWLPENGPASGAGALD
jgi:hypothetical protein